MPQTASLSFSKNASPWKVLARDEAFRLWHSCIGTEHLLLVILQNTIDLAARILVNNTITLDAAEEEIRKMVRSSETQPRIISLRENPRLDQVMQFACTHAQMTECSQIELLHFLLGMLDMPECIACKVIINLGVNPNDLRDEILETAKTGLITSKAPSRQEYVALKRALGDPRMTDKEAVIQATAIIQENNHH